MYEDLEASALRSGKQAAVDRLASVLYAGSDERVRLIGAVMSQGIVDKLAVPQAMNFMAVDVPPHFGLTLLPETSTAAVQAVHMHARRQLAALTEMGSIFLTRVLLGHTWSGAVAFRYALAAHSLNELLHNGSYLDRRGAPTKFLLRFVANELRGVLSRNYNRRLSTANLLKPFLETCGEFKAVPTSIVNTDVRVALRCMLPVVFEPIDGEFVGLGVTFANSDFGAGRLKVSGTCLRIKNGSAVILEDALCKVHLGSVIQESDLELSAETEDAELRTHQLAVRDTVREILRPESVEKTLEMIRVAHEHVIPWHTLRGRLSKVLKKSELLTVEKILTGEEAVVDLPPIDNQKATAWWAAGVLGLFADKEGDAERRLDMQALAGDLVSGVGAKK